MGLLILAVLGCGFTIYIYLALQGIRASFDEPDPVSTGESAKMHIAQEDCEIPESASDFYYWDIGFLSDHTTYWSFQCTSIEDCKTAASRPNQQIRFKEWELSKYDFIVKGPAYFGDKYQTDKWDTRTIQHGTWALTLERSKWSELQYSAIDYDTLRVYRLRWFGKSLTKLLEDLHFEEASRNLKTLINEAPAVDQNR